MNAMTGRKAWTAEQRRPDPAAMLQARYAVSIRADIYGTGRQVLAAIEELAAAWSAMDDTIREANITASAILPGFGKPLRTPEEAQAYTDALDALTAPLRHLVEHAEQLRENRRLIGVWSTALAAGRLGDGSEVPALFDDTARFPVASAVFARLTAARNAATVQALREAQSAPIGDVAWFAAQGPKQAEEGPL